MRAPVPSLTSHLGYWLRQVSNHVSHGFAHKLATLDVTVAEWALLRMLYDETRIAPSQLAERMGMTRGAVSKLADRLIAKRLVARAANPDDGRGQKLGFTSAGVALVPRLAEVADHNDAECFAHLTNDEREAFRRILHDIVTRLGITALALD